MEDLVCCSSIRSLCEDLWHKLAAWIQLHNGNSRRCHSCFSESHLFLSVSRGAGVRHDGSPFEDLVEIRCFYVCFRLGQSTAHSKSARSARVTQVREGDTLQQS